MNKYRTTITDIVERIIPLDERESTDMAGVLAWVRSGAELFRRVKPDVPDRHLVSYIVMVDARRGSILLLHHRRSGRWLPTGGHVELGENPRTTALRELEEELGLRAALVSQVADLPLFVTVTPVQDGDKRHTDVSLWYAVAADTHTWLDPDPREFASYRWLTLDEAAAMDGSETDPELHRFVAKLRAGLDGSVPASSHPQ